MKEMLVYLTLLASVTCLHIQGQSSFAYERDVQVPFLTQRPAVWSGNKLVAVDFDESAAPVIHAIGRDERGERIALDLPGAVDIKVFGYAAGFDGALAVVGQALSSEARSGDFLVWISPDRTRRTVVRLSPFVGLAVTIAADGNIWIIGANRTDNRDRTQAEGSLLKRFNTSGLLLSSGMPRVRASLNTAPDAASLSSLVSSRDRVGWFTNGNQLVEFGLDGKELGRYNGPDHMESRLPSGVAYDNDNRVLIGDTDDEGFHLLTLDRNGRSWIAVPLSWPSKPRYSRILGVDGSTLITAEHPDMIHRHAFIPKTP